MFLQGLRAGTVWWSSPDWRLQKKDDHPLEMQVGVEVSDHSPRLTAAVWSV